MRRLWSLNEIKKTFGLEPAQNDNFKKMWSLNEIKKISGLDLEELDTSRRMWDKKELLNLNQPYKNYALNIYRESNLENIFENAWNTSLTVDPLEISADSSWMDPRGKAQYPNGETEGVIIPSSVTTIGNRAFYGWESNNKPLVIPNSVTSIGGIRAFYGWKSNNQPLVIPDSVTSIGESAFSNWQANDQPLVIPSSVTTIGNYAFESWKANDQPLVIPSSVTTIGNYAFYDWPLVPYIEMQAITPPTLTNINAFDGQGNAPIYVPDESVNDYKAATNWSALASRIFSINDK
jgi:hypothetical protein